MVFKNKAQLERFIMGKCVKAVANAEEKVYEEFAGNLNQFYTEFKPEEYIRTGALFGSLKSTGAKKFGNTAIAEVRFDTPGYQHGWVPLQSGGFGFSYWDDAYILDVAMKGGKPHGGYAGGTPIWTESMDNLGKRSGIKNLLIQELKGQGL